MKRKGRGVFVGVQEGTLVRWRRTRRRRERGGVKNKSPVGRGAVQDGPKLFGTTPRAEGPSSARGNQVPLECDRLKRKTKQIFMPSSPPPIPLRPFRPPFFSAFSFASASRPSPSSPPPPASRPPREKH